MPHLLPQKKFEFIGRSYCLDLCNTMGGKRGEITREYLNTYLDFLSWSQQAGLVSHRQAQILAGKAVPHGAEAAAVLERTHRLREAIYGLFLAVLKSKGPSKTDVATLNGELARNQQRLQIECSKGPNAFAWVWKAEPPELDHPLGPVARSAAELLTSAHELSQVRQCNGQNCGWLFIDSSKNHSRRWCAMRDCGNRSKVRRHRQKLQR
jgi:predicted RNA-binding Zn ribbon-like protein